MNRSILLILFLIIFSQKISSQGKFAWCPEEQIIFPRNGFLEDKQIDLLICDMRNAEMAVVKCSGEAIKNNLIRLIKETYTSPDINVVTGKDPLAEPEENRVTIKIGILKYHVVASGAHHSEEIGSGKGNSGPDHLSQDKWKAISSYSVEISDYTKGKKLKVTKDISESTISPRAEDFGIAKDILNATFNDANRELITFIDDTFIQ